MISFMLGVLGSVLFWVIAVPINFIIALMIMKIFIPNRLNPITKGTCPYDGIITITDYIEVYILIILFTIFWPIILFTLLLYKIVNSTIKLIIPRLRKIINKLPTINIKINSDEEKKIV